MDNRGIRRREYFDFSVVMPAHGDEIELLRAIETEAGLIVETRRISAGLRTDCEGWPLFRIVRRAHETSVD